MTATELADGSFVALTCCGLPVKHRSTNFGWDGDFEKVRASFACETCGTQFIADASRDVGPPSGGDA